MCCDLLCVMCLTGASDIKTQSYDFVSIATIANMEAGAVVDVLAIVRSSGEYLHLPVWYGYAAFILLWSCCTFGWQIYVCAGECTEIISQKMGGKVLQKRDLTLVDDSGAEIRLTLWGDKVCVLLCIYIALYRYIHTYAYNTSRVLTRLPVTSIGMSVLLLLWKVWELATMVDEP